MDNSARKRKITSSTYGDNVDPPADQLGRTGMSKLVDNNTKPQIK